MIEKMQTNDLVQAYYKGTLVRASDQAWRLCDCVCARKGNLPADASSRSPEEQLSLLTIASKLFEYRWADERIQTEFDLYAELD